MKKILFVAASAILLAAGCQKTEVLNQAVGDPMTFSTEMSKLTKSATADGMTNLQEQGFKVWAYAAFADQLNGIVRGSVHDGMEALPVTYANSTWSTVEEYYWPGTDLELDFFALSTKSTSHTVAITGAGAEELNRTMSVTNYTVNHADPNDDLMVAQFVRQHQGMNGKAVSVKFKHALSKVQFKFITNVDDNSTDAVTIKSLTVDGLDVKGDLTVTEGNGTADATTGVKDVTLAWSNLSGSGEGVQFGKVADLTLTSTAQDYAAWLVMPQDLEGHNVKIEYTIVGSTGTKEFDHTFALAATNVTSWGINQVTTYTLNISPNKITFTPDVLPWEDEDTVSDQN